MRRPDTKPKLTNDDCKYIVQLYDPGGIFNLKAQDIAELVGFSTTTIYNAIAIYKKEGRLTALPHPGGPKKFNKAARMTLIQYARHYPWLSLS